jgi:alpha-D-ribose 1-methylphosphonate 5-triphosphate synthase subunit PhnL
MEIDGNEMPGMIVHGVQDGVGIKVGAEVSHKACHGECVIIHLGASNEMSAP